MAKVSRIASGVPVGGDLEYIDEVTLLRLGLWREEWNSDPEPRGYLQRKSEKQWETTKITSSRVWKSRFLRRTSMILNRRNNVSFSVETVERVEQAARELGYELPGRRKTGDNKKEKLIVVFCPTLASPYYVLLLQGIEAVANEKGYGVFICNTQRDAVLEEKYLRMIRTIQPQGIIYTCNQHPDFQKKVEEMAREVPLVIISNKEKTTTVDAINQDNTMVGRLMARHLLDLGHRDVAFITPPLTRRQWQRFRRIDGFVKEFEREGLKGHVLIKAADESMDRTLPRMDSEYSMGYQLTMELLKEEKYFTAIAGQNDMMAIGAIDAGKSEDPCTKRCICDRL